MLLSALAAAVVVPLAAVGVSAASATIDESPSVGGLELIPTASLDATERAPGTVIERVLTLHNAGTASYRAIDVGSTVAGSVAALHLDVVRCDTGWTSVAAGYLCAGNETLVMAGPVGASAPLTTAAALRPGGSDSLLMRLTLPAQSGASARVTYSAVGR